MLKSIAIVLQNFILKMLEISQKKIFVSNEGTYFRYDLETNDFGIINKYGGISTYFKPDDGLEYWIDQIYKYGGN